MPVDKIKRNFVWLRKILRITEKTTLPGEVLGDVRVGMDLFGWEVLAEQSTIVTSGTTGATTVNGTLAPEGFLRLVLHADVEHNDGAGPHVCWMTKRTQATVTTVGVVSPLSLDDAETNVLPNRLILAAGDRLVARAATMGAGAILRLTLNFIDLPVGEYIAPW